MLDYDKIRAQLKSGQKITVPKGTTAIGSVQKNTPQKVVTQTDMNASKGGSNPLGDSDKNVTMKKVGNTVDVAGEGLKVGVQQGAKGVATAAAGVGTTIKNWDYETLNPARQDREVTFGTYDRDEYLKRQAARDAQKEIDMDKADALIDTLPGLKTADANAQAFAKRLENETGFNRMVGEVAQGVGGMLPGLAASAVNPGAGLAVLAASAGGGAMDEARKAGASFDEAYTYGVLSGVKEAATEKMFGGLKFVGDGFVSKLPGVSRVTGAVGDSAKKLIAKNADTIIGKFMANSATRAIINTAKDASGEGVEEFVSGLVDPYLRRMTFDPNASSAELSDLVNQALIGGLTAVVMNGVASTAALPGKVKGTRDYNEAVRKQVEDLNVLASVIPADIRPEPMKVSSHTTQEEVDLYKAEVGRIMQENTDRIAKEAAMVSEIGAEDSVGSLEDAVSRDESSARAMYGDFAVDQYNAQRENMIRNGYIENAAHPVAEAELDNTVLAEEAMMKYQKAVDLAKTVFGTEDLSPAQKEQFKNQYNVDFDTLRAVVDEEIANLELSPVTRFRKVLESDFATARRVYGADVVDRYMAMQGTNRTGANSIFTVNGRNVTRFEALAEMRKRYPQATEEALTAMYNEAYAELVAEERKADPEKFKKLEDYEKTANIRLKKCGLKLEVRWDMNNTEEAYYDKATQTIVLNGNIIHKPSVASFITAHELAHYAVANDPAFLQDIRVAAKAIGYDLEAGKERRRGPYAEAELDEEAVADFIAQMTTDASIIEQLTKTRPSLLERIITYLKETLTLHKHDRIARAQKREVIRRLNKALEGKPVPPTVEQKVEQAVQRQVVEETKNVAPKATEVEANVESKVEPPAAKNVKRELSKKAAELENEYRILLENSKLTRGGIANNLNAAAQMIEMGEEQAARDVIENLAYELNGGDLKHKQTAGVKVEEASSLRKDLKNVTLHVTPEMRSEWPDYGEFRKNAAKIVKLSTKGGREVDTVYAELRELYPWLLDVSNPADQVNTLITMASVNEEIPGLSEEQMADVQKLTDKIMSDLHELTGTEAKSESVGAEEIPFSKSPVKYSLATYDQKQKDNWASSKRIVVYENSEQATRFVEDALSGSGNRKLYFGRIPKDLASVIKEKTGEDVENYNCSITESEIRKILMHSHGDEKTENLRGQRAVRVEDIVRIPEVIQSPDEIRLAGTSGHGKPAIHFVKEIDGRETIVTYVSDKHRDLAVQTMYIGIKKGNLATPTDDQASVNTPKASRGTASTNSVTQAGSESNIKKSLSPTNSWGHKLSPGQQRYFKDSKVTDTNGCLIPVYHGTMSDFYVFDRTKGNKEGNMGSGFYFTDNEEDVWRNYANIDGPDLQSKIEQMAQRLIDYEDMPEEAAYAQARERWMTRTEPRLIEAYVNITKPVVVGGENSTFFDFDSGEVYDEETDSYDYGEPSGLLVDFLYALENVLEDYDVYKPDWGPFVSDLYYEAMDDGGISAYDLTQMVRFRLAEVHDMETGDIAIGEVMRQAFEDMGFDGIIDHTVSGKFPGMRLDQDTTHYIAFFPEQAKEVDNLNPTSNADIRYSKSPGRIFYTPGGVEVVQNPTNMEYAQMRNDVYSAYPWMKESGEPPLRRTFDEKGNEYYWSSADAIHADVEPHINRKYNTRTSQHWKWWERDDKDDYPIKYSRSMDYAPTFYSQMERVVKNTKQEKLGAASVIPMLKGRGVKDEEIKWTGLAEWLEGKKSVTKQELLAFIKANQLELEEEVLETTEYPVSTEDALWATLEQREEIEELWQEAFGEEMPGYVTTADDFSLAALEEFESMIPGVISEETLSEEELALYTALNRLEDGTDGVAPVAKPPRWAEYKLGGGENYREYKFKMPGSDYSNNAMEAHWGDKGVLAHARVQDFMYYGKPVLFIEEIQSDWHNEGKKKGYAPKDRDKAYETLRDLNRRVAAMRERFTTVPELKSLVDKLKPGIIDDYNRFGMAISEIGVWESAINSVLTHRGSVVDFVSGKGITLTAEEVNAFDNIREEAKTMTAEQVRYHDALNNAPPEAPFRNTYQEYVLKRLLREAAENGYSYLAWTTGKMQEDRWSSNYAEGYRIEYDQDIPKFLNKYGKKWGAQVEKIKLGANMDDDIEGAFYYELLKELNATDVADDGKPEVWAIPITDEMRDAVLYEGQPKYSKEIDWDRMNQLWEKYQQAYGIKPRSGEVPEQINQDTRVSDFMESAYMAADGNEEMQNVLKSRIVTGEGSYVPMSDKKATDWARKTIEHSESDALGSWNTSIRKTSPLSKQDIALGEILLTEAMARGDIKTAEKLVADLCVEANRAGQNLQAFSLLRKLSAEGRMYHTQRSIDKLQEDLNERRGDKAPKLKMDQELLEKLSKATTLEEADKVQEEILKDIALQIPPRISDRVVAWRYLSMLGNARTHIRNTVSNMVMQLCVRGKDVFAGASEDLFLSGKDTERTKTLKPVSREMKQFAKQQWVDMKAQLTSGGKNGFDDIINRYRKNFGDSPAGKVLNYLSEGNSKLLEGEDTIFKRVSFEHAFAKYCTANNLTMADLTSGTKAMNARLAQARAYATNEAMKSVFQDASDLAKWLNQIEKKNTATKLIVGGLMPFKKTPMNVLKRGMEYSPVGIAQGIKMAFDKSSNGAEVIDRLSSGLTGTGLMVLGFYLAKQGILFATGGDDESDKEKYYKEMLGQQDYSFNTGGVADLLEEKFGVSVSWGNHSYTVDWLTPAMIPLMAGVEAWNASETLIEEGIDGFDVNVASRIVGAMGKIADPVMNLSCLSSFNDAMSSFSDNSITAVGVSAAESFALQFIPTISGQIGRTVDDTRRTTYTEKDAAFRGAQMLLKRIQNKTVPMGVEALGIDPLEPYVDMWGREDYGVTNKGLRALEQMASPGYLSSENRTAVDDEITTLLERTGEQGILPKAPSSTQTINGVSYYIDADDYTAMQKKAGSVKYSTLDELFRTPLYQSMPDEEKVAMIEKVHSYGNAVAKADWAEKNNIAMEVSSDVAKAMAGAEVGLSATSVFLIRDQLSAIGGDGAKDKRIDWLNGQTWLTGEQKRMLMLSMNSEYKNLPW